MTSRETILDMVESFKDKITSEEYRQVLEELGKMPAGVLVANEYPRDSEPNPHIEFAEPVDDSEFWHDYVTAQKRSKQLSVIPFLLTFKEKDMHEMCGVDYLMDETGKYTEGTGFGLRVGSAEFLFVKRIIQVLGYEMEAVELNDDRCIKSNYLLMEGADFILLKKILKPLGYNLENDERTIDTYPQLDIRGISTNYPWKEYTNLLQTVAMIKQ